MSSLKTKLWNLGVSAEDLDSIVDDGASQIASRVNKEGMSAQLRFLQEQCQMSEEDIIKAVQDSISALDSICD
ncbi:hypothetical protein I633_22631 (plasmid) [Alteromonas mediterranea 615]|uniref:Uncharacterized protein n=1 Tax=Alteromonas mediterranea 615 TaxID=1300253 RepID=S5ALS9_9ALTE|nr:hypothetical protein I633_22631 [Alteromonas mediterranea 615]|tara:strand:+ start:382 stop:600 length:219 start_codon:yes stop_codon:yes gene_type:complete